MFEVQLSTTFLSVIVKRDLFYKSKNTFIVWVFNKFSESLREQRFTDKDILYANRNNIFIVDETTLQKSQEAGELILRCHALHSTFTHGDIHPVWEKDYVPFSQFQFDTENYRIFWKNVQGQYDSCLTVKRQADEKRMQQEEQRIAAQKFEEEEQRVEELRQYKLRAMMSDFSKDEREIFQERAAIMEYEGCLPRAEAERLAMERILALRE